MSPDEPVPGEQQIADLAALIADGRPIDWDDPASMSGSGLGPTVRDLRIIHEIALLHRRLSESSQASNSATSAPASAPRTRAPEFPPDAKHWGPLVVLESLGAGAFGEVFRAWDTTLDREVALKLLKRRRRPGVDSIAREGQLLARVSHPNVMAIYGALEVDGQVGIWGELLRGRTLARMISQEGPLSAEETLVFAEAICRALATAHRAGLLHRDVKAENVIREKGGRIVLTDFGLGRELEDVPTGDSVELAGTPVYLAPELFSGGRASVQSDIYGVGVLMFFLVTGSFPVTGRSLKDIAHAHGTRKRQGLRDLRPELPGAFVHVVECAIEIDPAQRFESCGAMQSALAAAGQPMRDAPSGPRGWRMLLHPLVAAVALGLAAASALLTVWLRPPVDALIPSTTVAVSAPQGTQIADSSRSAPALSPDGRYLAFVAVDPNGDTFLWRQDLLTGESVKVANSAAALEPFWSQQGDGLGFFELGGTLRWGSSDGKRVDGSVRTASEPRGAAWNAGGVVVFPKGPRTGLFQFSSATGVESPLIPLDSARGELGLMYPQFLPDGKRFVYFTWSHDPSVRGVYLGSLAGGPGTKLVQTDSSAVVAGNDLLFLAGEDLVARRILQNGSLDSAMTTAARGVAANWDFAVMASATADGRLVYLPDNLEHSELAWFDRRGAKVDTLPLEPGRHRSPAISRDGRYLAVQKYVGSLSQIEVFDIEARRRRHLVETSPEVEFPVWGTAHQLLYTSIDNGRDDMWVKDLDDDEPARLFFGGPERAGNMKLPVSWSPDGRYVTFLNLLLNPEQAKSPTTRAVYELNVLNVAEKSIGPFRSGHGIQIGGQISPDGRKVTYRRRQVPKPGAPPPTRELWVSDFPAGTRPQLVAVNGIDAGWPSNNEVSYFDSNGNFTIVSIPPLDSPRWVVTPVVSFPVGVFTPGSSRNNYSWAPGGTRVLVNRPAEGRPPMRFRLVLNWKNQSQESPRP